MAVTATNLIQGPGLLYSGAFGVAEPTDALVNTSPSSSTWTDVGGTSGGLELEIDLTYAELEVDQLVDVVESRLTSRRITAKTSIAEPTLANLALVLNGGTITASAAFSTYDPADDVSSTQQTYKALLFDAYAPRTVASATMRRRVALRKTLSAETIGMPYTKEDQTLLPVTFKAHWVSPSIKPFRIVDQLT